MTPDSPRRRRLSLLLGLGIPLAAFAQLGDRDSLPLGGRPRPLPISEAFPWFVSIEGDRRLAVTWQPAPQHYLYRHQFAFGLVEAGSATAVPIPFTLPAGKPHTDQFFGDIEAYYDLVTAHLDLPPGWQAPAELQIHYQGCADWGFCYPPQQDSYRLLPP